VSLNRPAEAEHNAYNTYRMKRSNPILSLALFALTALVCLFVIFPSAAPPRQLSQAQFNQILQANLISQAQLICPRHGLTNEVRGRFYEADASGQILLINGTRRELRFSAMVKNDRGETLQKLTTISNFSILERRW